MILSSDEVEEANFQAVAQTWVGEVDHQEVLLASYAVEAYPHLAEAHLVQEEETHPVQEEAHLVQEEEISYWVAVHPYLGVVHSSS
jgi:hypothetical protein